MESRELPTRESRWTFWFRCDWLQLFKRCNWYNFCFIEASVENEVFMGNLNWTFGLLGFCAGGAYCYTKTEAMAEMQRRMEEMLKEHGEDK